MNRFAGTLKKLMLGLAASAALFLATQSVLADKVLLKSGKTVECTIVKEDKDFLTVKYPDGTEGFIDRADIKSIERDAPADKKPEAKPAAKPGEPEKGAAPAAPAVPSGGKKKDGEKKKDRAVDGATNVAILNFGPPSSWQGKIEGTVGVQINAKSWRAAIPLLEKDNTDVVVVRVNSGGGALSELERFHNVFENEYKKRWRTVVWVESAISAACMSPWILEEWYFMSEGSAGACTGWYGDLQMMQGPELLDVLYMMEKVSEKGRHAKQIMRSMEIVEPLSCNIDDNGIVTWFQDATGKYLVNPQGQILTFNARDAVKYKFARGIADTPEELAKVMGLNEVNWVGKDAAKSIDDNMRKNDEAEKTWQEVYTKYQIALRGARALMGEQNRDRRLMEVGVARRHLNKLEELMKINPTLGEGVRPRINADWFAQQRDLLKQLSM